MVDETVVEMVVMLALEMAATMEFLKVEMMGV